MISSDSLRSLFQSLGFTEWEIRTLRCLMETGPNTPMNIARGSDVPKQKVSAVLNRLERKGMVSHRQSRPKTYFISDLEVLAATWIREKQEELGRIYDFTTVLDTFPGKARSMVDDTTSLLRYSERTLPVARAVKDTKEVARILEKDYRYIRSFEPLIINGVATRFVTSESARSGMESRLRLSRRNAVQVRYLPDSFFVSMPNFCVLDQTVAFLFLGTKERAIRSSSVAFVTLLTLVHDAVFSQSPLNAANSTHQNWELSKMHALRSGRGNRRSLD